MKKNIKIIAPSLPESINNAIILKWHKKIGDVVKEDELIIEIETDKIILEVASPASGILYSQMLLTGEKIKSKTILGYIKQKKNENITKYISNISHKKYNSTYFFTPKMRRLISNYKINKLNIKGVRMNGKITKDNFIITNEENKKKRKQENILFQESINSKEKKNIRNIQRITMSPLRKKISERLLSTIQNTAMLTTFNEVNMQQIILIKKNYQDIFKNTHKSRLGYMSFYIKAVTQALKKFPELNASIEGTDILYHNYYDINIAVSTPRGLITPILKNTDCLSMLEIEKKIQYFSNLGQSGKLKLEDLESGTFTITNGGVFGSLMSTPIINPPQVAILGMHNIINRPVVIDNEILIKPMMYLALSYDHQLIDGKQAIQFLKCVKENIEDISRILLDL
ncbi:dihydrolipoyllysine-residue succinyltransferase [Buchnera aphidicola]|uniref:Dihydrolipoyllysine-residue succinyltransferase n=1 Tax=Buchnera aphidicola (Cinara strobi) TaxID=1921549 RepID=A0A3B1DW73_9GAMM|nr:dihydrolipoyllysine-residue succinyltransferase [Buchnera aphidicola]VAX76543.1 Dihydrolipoyllysine-residue succinyltransferase component of 2-oxoglutarate dehydrogenase complex [Buchnera aphidicola (Cinara strobi)]